MLNANCTKLSDIRLTELTSIPLANLFEILSQKPLDVQQSILEMRSYLLKQGR